MTKILVDAKELETALKTLLPFTSKEEARYHLGGVYIHGDVRNGHISLAATDGHKLCAIQIAVNVTENTDVKLDHILPTNAVKTVLQMIKSHEDKELPAELSFDIARVGFSVYVQTSTFKVIDGTFPDYTKVIPKGDAAFSIGLLKEQAIEATKAVRAHKGSDVMRWEFIDNTSPIKLVSENKVVVIMPARELVSEIPF
jgi:DNA polymerase III sliding clamp (beta) subunit (PCNA family)